MSWGLLLQQAQKRHKDQVKIRTKNERRWFWRLLSIILKVFTLGMGPDLLNGPYTTLGRTIWIPGDGSSFEAISNHSKYAIISHELDHMDMEFFGDHTLQDAPYLLPKEKGVFFRFIHALKYLFWPFPIFGARYRQQIEFWGFQRNLEVHIANRHGLMDPAFISMIKGYLHGPYYAWMASEKRADELMGRMIQESMAKFRAGELDHLRL